MSTGVSGAGPRLAGRIAVITGGGSGIGRATSVRFSEEGASVVVVDQDAAGATETVSLITERGGVASSFPTDVTDESAAERIIGEVVAQHGSVDVLMMAAATSVGKTVPDTTPEEWDRVFEVNVKGTYLWMRASIPVMSRQGRGSIIAVTSQLAFSGGLGNAAYIATKGAIVSLCRTSANDHAREGVRINCVVPGATQTPLLDRSFGRFDDPAPYIERSLARHPLGRFGRPEEVANAALFLACDESSFTTGSEIRVDGGWIGG